MSGQARWTVVSGRNRWDVCGFLHPDPGREHVVKHFLSPDEFWQELSPGPQDPGTIRDRIRAVGLSPTVALQTLAGDSAARDILDEALGYYTAASCHACLPKHHPAASETLRREEDGRIVRRLSVASGAGVFLCFRFRAADVSDLLTAFRPSVRMSKPGTPASTRERERRARDRLVQAEIQSLALERKRTEEDSEMQNHIETTRDSLGLALERTIDEAADWMDLASRFESYRRLLLAGGNQESASGLLDQAATRLRETARLFDPDVLETVLASVLDALTLWSDRPACERDVEEGEELLVELADIEHIVAAAFCQAGAPRSWTDGIATRLVEATRRLAPAMHLLAEAAAIRQEHFAPSPEIPALSFWLDGLAELAPSRLALASGASRLPSATRERIIARAVERFTAPSMFDAFVRRIEALLQSLVIAPISAGFRCAGADEDVLPQVHEIACSDDFALMAIESGLVLRIAEGHAVEVTRLVIDGTEMSLDRVVRTEPGRLQIPIRPEERASSLELAFSIDGFRMPPVRIVWG